MLQFCTSNLRFFWTLIVLFCFCFSNQFKALFTSLLFLWLQLWFWSLPHPISLGAVCSVIFTWFLDLSAVSCWKHDTGPDGKLKKTDFKTCGSYDSFVWGRRGFGFHLQPVGGRSRLVVTWLCCPLFLWTVWGFVVECPVVVPWCGLRYPQLPEAGDKSEAAVGAGRWGQCD